MSHCFSRGELYCTSGVHIGIDLALNDGMELAVFLVSEPRIIKALSRNDFEILDARRLVILTATIAASSLRRSLLLRVIV